MNILKRILCLMCAVVALSGSFAATPVLSKNKKNTADSWTDSVYSSLTPRQRVAQLVFPKLVPTQGESSKAAIRKAVKIQDCGGILFTEGSLAQYVEMTNYAQSLAQVPLLMTFDGEWGLSMRVKDTPRFPHNMALGAITDYKLLYRYGAEMARECKLAGVQANFAPDADVNSNPSNPVIGYRAFGENPERVAKAAVAYSLGMEDAGVQSVAKHFPGHGDTDVDSHKALPEVSHSLSTLDSTDLVPFKEYIGAGCSGIMVGHISVPALDPSLTPASLSKVITTDLLREKMKFDGLIYTDALGMKGAVDPKGRNTGVAALLAGADVLLCPLDTKTTVDAVMQAVENGILSESVVEDRCKRILRYKYYLGLENGGEIDSDADALRNQIDSPEARNLIRELCNASITVLKNSDSLLPLKNVEGRTIAVVNIGAGASNEFSNTCLHYGDVKIFHTSGELFSQASLAKITACDVVVAAVYNDKSMSRNVLSQLAGVSKNMVAVFMVNPYKMQKFSASFSKIKSLVLAYDDISPMRESAAQAIFGGISVGGILPVNLRGVAKEGTGIMLPKIRLGFSTPEGEGMSSWLTDSIDALVKKGLRTGAFPGCQVLVARNGNIVYDKAFGHISNAQGAAKVDHNTLYDLASVSKAIGTLPGIMKAYDIDLLNLEDNLGRLIPEIVDTAKQNITVRQLLYHESGMPASMNMFNAMMDSLTYEGKLITSRPDKKHTIKIQRRAYGNNTAKLRRDILSTTSSDKFPIAAAKGLYTGAVTYDTIMRRIYDVPLRSSNSYNYSCLNFCLLMDIEQRVTGRGHNDFVTEEIFRPIGANRTVYRPTTKFGLNEIAATEHDTFLRRQTVHGYVHDELSAFSGGVQGNAGLFSTADDVAKVCQMWLNGGEYAGQRVLSPETVELFTTAKSATCRRGLGFDKPDVEDLENSPTCDEAGPEVYGHLGFTGTVFWVDPKEELIFVFLTNRVNPTRDNTAFNKLNIRPRLFSQVYKSLKK